MNNVKSLQKTKPIEYKILICAKFAQFWTILRNTFRSIFEYGFYETEAKRDWKDLAGTVLLSVPAMDYLKINGE